jgi:enediyne biosynthesis protein E4
MYFFNQLDLMTLNKTRSLFFIALCVILSGCVDSTDKSLSVTTQTDIPPFESQISSNTGITFKNTVEDQDSFNILTYRNYYNGGGVGIGDINNDGLVDIYFTGNMIKNKLYLNKGDFKFEDITESAGVEGNGAWSTGVAMSDVNGDGWIDIYVCNSGDVEGQNRANELFINNKNGTFTESAKEYGLADEGYSTHAVFIDLDMDGDLDCYVLNNSYKDPARISFYEKERFKYGLPGGDRIYFNVNGKFIDKTKESGIYSSDIGFGLGASIGDLNNDLLPDIFISNDFWERDYLYFNKGNGVFYETLIDHMPYVSVASMGSDIADLNNDGWMDIFSTDMLPHTNQRLKTSLKFDEFFLGDLKWKYSYYHQYVQNCLFINQKDKTFKELAHFAGVAATDWSWGALIFDINLDGLKDIYVCNGVYHDITDADFTDFIGDMGAIKKVVSEHGRYDFRDFKKYLPYNPQKNFAFINKGNLKFENLADVLNLSQEGYSNGAAYADLDNDGDFDLVINNVNMDASILKNNAVESGKKFIKIKLTGPEKNIKGIGTKVKLMQGNQIQIAQSMQSRGFQSSVDSDIIFGLASFDTHSDSILIVWPDQSFQIIKGDLLNKTIEVSYKDHKKGLPGNKITSEKINFANVTTSIFSNKIVHEENDYIDYNSERLMPRIHSTEGPKIMVGDINGDQFQDAILLGASGQSDQLLLYKNGKYFLSNVAAFETDKDSEGAAGLLYDFDEDGDLDYLVGAGGNEYQKGFKSFVARYYENDGKGKFTRNFEKFKDIVGQVSCIEMGDYNGDGLKDIFIGGRSIPGNYGLTPRSFVLKNLGKGNFEDVTDAVTGPLGMVTGAKWFDIDKDGREELIVVGEWMAIMIIKYTATGFQEFQSIKNSYGWWSSLEMADLDSDGDMDFVVGNWGKNSKFKASVDKPIKMFVNDFDKNNKVEPLIEWFYQNDTKAFPFASKADLTSQLPFLKKKVLKYKDFATSQLTDLIDPTLLEKSEIKHIETLQSVFLINTNGKMEMMAMPDDCQYAPIFTTLHVDVDGDECKDILFGGNFFRLKPEIGRQEGFNGGYLKGNCKGKYDYVSRSESGLVFSGEIRDLKLVNQYIWCAKNNDHLQVFKPNSKKNEDITQ